MASPTPTTSSNGPPPRAQRPDYEHRTERDWRQAIPYVMNCGQLTPEQQRQEEERAHRAHEAEVQRCIR